MITIILVLVALLLPARSRARPTAQRAQSMNNMKQILLAILDYEKAHGTLPPAYIADKDGKPLLSWRVLILPYLDCKDLYDQFHLDEPWDSDHNKQLIEKMPGFYRDYLSKLRDSSGKRTISPSAVRRPSFPARKRENRPRDRPISNPNHAGRGVGRQGRDRTKPDDFEYDEKDPIKGLVGLNDGFFFTGWADASVDRVKASIDPKILLALFTREGCQEFDQEKWLAKP